MASTSADHRPSAEGPDYLQPRARRPGNPHVFRALNDGNGLLKVQDVPPAVASSGLSSGRSTPIPQDAPPSVHATSSARKQVRAQQKHRIFPTIEYAARLSHFDPNSDYRDFRGFFVLFWIGLAIMVITAMLRNVKETGYPLLFKQWPLFTENIVELALSDFGMVASTVLSLPLHKLYRSSQGPLRWSRGGMVVQSIYQAIWLGFWVNLPFAHNWTWTAQVFFTLHLLAIFMKMHSYAFYNGHLSETLRRLDELDRPETASTAAAIRYPRSHDHLRQMKHENESEDNRIDAVSSVAQLREDLALELTSPLGHVTYPSNLSSRNYLDFLLCPTLCYELEYPRTSGTNWMELFYKTLAVFGCIFLLTVTSEEFIIPVLDESAERLHGTSTISEGGLILAETINRLLFPFMVSFLLVFLVIFEYVLGAFAEITCFADRHFYADWWNSCDWLEFSREWNIPVHHFFRRHVYSASLSHMSRPVATVITFLISALAHELVMGCISKKVRGYGFFAMMLQMPIVMVQRSKYVRGRTLLNNVLFWCSMILGLSMMCALYVLV
ncbi:MBOAT, membrane-bound O-acyltransferase family-domain-containing protein [Lineolata rhizophorae]|uniref:O-acyltransferase n=1 Tax=Lineolata rhizophorae TaxID=578093 RepID=A0A6A6NW72_9PEZI|nr:MBOAT, membrane-bound O-acyltransferase family-domain-containing protein [Lineolata rhizophorae]